MAVFYTLKKQEQRDKRSEEREENYQSITEELTSKFNIIEDIKVMLKRLRIIFLKDN